MEKYNFKKYGCLDVKYVYDNIQATNCRGLDESKHPCCVCFRKVAVVSGNSGQHILALTLSFCLLYKIIDWGEYMARR